MAIALTPPFTDIDLVQIYSVEGFCGVGPTSRVSLPLRVGDVRTGKKGWRPSYFRGGAFEVL